MSKRKLNRECVDATTADFEVLSLTLGRVLPQLLGVGDHVALVRWSQVRSWIDNALDGELSLDLATIDLVVVYFAELVGMQFQDVCKQGLTMSGKIETWSGRLAAASAAAVVAEGHASMLVVEDDDIDGAMTAVQSEQAQWQKLSVESRQRVRVKSEKGMVSWALSERVRAVVASAIAAGEVHDWSASRTQASIEAELRQLRRYRMQESGIQPVRIPQQTANLKAAICTLLQHLDESKQPSAKRTVLQAGLSGTAATKLAYRVPIKSETANACTCLLRNAPFVKRLHTDTGQLHLVNDRHKSLAELGEVLACAHLSLAG